MKGRHRSIDKALKKSIEFLCSINGVSKLVLGFSECCRHKYSPGYIKIKSDVDAGIKVNGYSGKGVTDIFIKIEPISDRDKVKSIIEEKFKLK